jgi:5'-phosphate synthase pdxT subunit
MIFLSKNSKDKVVGKVEQPLLDVLDVKIERNSFGRQKDSFEANISMEPVGISSFNGVFIRAPSVSETGSDVEILAKFNEKIVAVKQGNILATAFHPELTRDISLHKSFVKLVDNLN